MLNYKRLAPRSADPKVYTHNNEKITHQEADMINNGTFIEGETSVPGEYITAQEVVQKLAAQHKHVNYMIGGDELNELVCYYTWSSDTIDPTGVHIPDLEMTVEDRKLLAYEITPENADVTSAVFSIVSGSDIAHIDGSYVIADKQGTATYKVVINGSIEDTATINVSNKPEEFPDDQEHRWIRVQPESSQISVDGGTIHVTGSYGLTGSYGTEKKVGDITDTIVIESNSSQDPKSGSKTYYYNNNQFDTPTAEITWTQPGRSEEFPDDEEHRWIEVSPTQFTFPADGGSVDITGSYGLTGTFGTRKKVGDITDTITVDANVTASSKSGSKTYYYNNDQSQTPTSEVSWTQPNIDTTQIIVPKFSIDGNTWTTTPMVLSWEAENTNALTYYYRVEVVTKNASTGETISTTNFDKIGYTIVNQNGDHFNASINGNKVTVRPISANTSYTDTIKTILSITPLGKETNYEFFGQSTFIHQYKGVKVENGDIVVFTFGWNAGKDLDCATYVNDHVVGNEKKYAGWFGGAVNSNVGGKNEYLMFAGDNQGTGKEYTCIDFNALSKYIENHADYPSTINGKKLKESFIDSDGNFVITIDIYNNWYSTKDTEDIELNYSAYNYTQKSIVPTINSTDNKTFAITGATIVKTNLDNATCYANYQDACYNVKRCYTKTAEFVYYLNSGQFYIKTNKGNVGLWNKGFSTKEESKDYNPKYSNSTSLKNNNINYSVQIDSINLPKNKTVSLHSGISVSLYREPSHNYAFSIDFPMKEIQNNTTFPKTYSDNISTSDLISKVLEKIQNDEDFKSNTYISGISGYTSIFATSDYTVPEYFEYKNLTPSNSVNPNIKVN